MKPTIYFDLDGTLYDLYGRESWLARITELQDPTAYADEDATLVDMIDLHETILRLLDSGYQVGVVSWLAKDSTPEYRKAVRAVKHEWVKKFLPFATEIHIVKYGTPKHHIIRDKSNAILVDDNADVRNAWTHGMTIDATQNLIEALKELPQ